MIINHALIFQQYVSANDDIDRIHAGNTVFLSLTCSSKKEIDKFFTSLSAGGEITRPLHDFFAGMIGALTDKYGMNWMLYL